jgi:hypothetical protein
MGGLLAALAVLVLLVMAGGAKGDKPPPALPGPPDPEPEPGPEPTPTQPAGELTEAELGWLVAVDSAAEVAADVCPDRAAAIEAIRVDAQRRIRGSDEPETVAADAVFAIEGECAAAAGAGIDMPPTATPGRCAAIRAEAESMWAQAAALRIEAVATGDPQLLRAIADLEKQANERRADAARCEAEL